MVSLFNLTFLVKKEIDSLQLKTTWGNNGGSGLKVQVTGLYLQGCKFDGTRLYETSGDDEPFSTVDACYFSWVPKEEKTECNGFNVPLYEDGARSRLICRVQVPVGGDSSVWIQYGVAMFLNPEI